MAHEVVGEKSASTTAGSQKNVGVMGSRRIFAIAFKLQVLDSYRNDIDCRGNQRATARKFGIHRRQIQKWLQCESSLRNSSSESTPTRTNNTNVSTSSVTVKNDEQPPQQLHQQQGGTPGSPALNLSLARLHGDANELPPPPPLPSATAPPVANAASVAPTQQALAANAYRFHGSSSPVLYPQASYPLIDHHHPIYPAPPPPPQPQIAYQQHQSTFEIAAADFQRQRLLQQSSAFEPPVKTEVSDENRNYYQNRPLAVHHIKLERAISPDSLSPKRERCFEEDEQQLHQLPISVDYRRTSLGSSDAGSSLESLPPSPRDSERSSASTPDSEAAMMLPRRRSFSLRFKLDVLDAFYKDTGVAGNQRATARKFGINRRQVQKWLGQESELRGVVELCSNNRQRLGSSVSPVDLRTTELGPPSFDYADSSLTPPYSAPGCPHSCCQDQPYYCYSPAAIEEQLPSSLKRIPCMQSCCVPELPPFKKQCISEDEEEEPLCLVKPKRPDFEPVTSTVPSPPVPNVPKRDAILFKPYLDNPVVSKTEQRQQTNNNNNNCQETCNLNEQRNRENVDVEVNYRMPWRLEQPQQYVDFQQVKSAFVRYPISNAYYA